MIHNKSFIFRNKHRTHNDFRIGTCTNGVVTSGGKRIGYTGNGSDNGTILCVKTSNGYSFIKTKTARL